MAIRRYALTVGPQTDVLRKKFKVHSIPSLIVVDSNGQVVSERGREEVENNEDPLSLWFPGTEALDHFSKNDHV